MLAEAGYPGLLIFVAIIVSSILPCRRVRNVRRARRVPTRSGVREGTRNGLGVVIGGSFVSFQYCEMLWHYFGLTMVLEAAGRERSGAITTMAAMRGKFRNLSRLGPW